jgi:hypothetical protein
VPPSRHAHSCSCALHLQVQYGKQSQELKRPATSTIAELKADVRRGLLCAVCRLLGPAPTCSRGAQLRSVECHMCATAAAATHHTASDCPTTPTQCRRWRRRCPSRQPCRSSCSKGCSRMTQTRSERCVAGGASIAASAALPAAAARACQLVRVLAWLRRPRRRTHAVLGLAVWRPQVGIRNGSKVLLIGSRCACACGRVWTRAVA